MTHINIDLAGALLEHGVGNNADWDCVGKIVNECSNEHLHIVEQGGAWLAGKYDGEEYDPILIRNGMRERVRRLLNGGQPGASGGW